MGILKASDIREILKVTQDPGIISFAGGLPAPELFPASAIAACAADVLAKQGTVALQYSPTEGFFGLRQIIAGRMNAIWHTQLIPEEILVTTGSQQGLDLTGKLFLDEGDVVLCESPTYLGAIMAFNVFKPRWVEIPTDDEGMDPEALEDALRTHERIKLIYTVPNFQNPTGRTWSDERRERLSHLAAKYEVPVIEDNPYGEVCFEGSLPRAIQAMDSRGLVICLGTFSKIFCPGLRLGWVAAHRRYLDKYVILKQAGDLHTSTLDQMIAASYMETHDLEKDIQHKREVYRNRRDAMLSALATEMPPGVSFTRPKGGLFLWVELPASLDARRLLARSLEQHVAFVPGEAFFPTSGRKNTLRLNYSNMPEERIIEGVRRLAVAVRKELEVGRTTKEPMSV
jgi:DNA-binding transcriptional MocR family regulator